MKASIAEKIKSKFLSPLFQDHFNTVIELVMRKRQIWEKWLKKYLKVYGVIYWLNKNLKAMLDIIRRKVGLILKLRPYMNIWSIKEGTFLWGKNAKNVDKKLVLDSFLILVNSPKQPMNAKLLKENYQKNLSFCFAPYSFMDKIMKSKRSQKVVTSLSLRCQNCLKKFIFKWSIAWVILLI